MKKMEKIDDTVKKWLNKLEEIKKGDVDLSRDEDLSIAIMNLISLEEHCYFTAMKTQNQKYLEMLDSVRSLRKTMLGKIVKNPVGEEWCMSKHLLAASMRLVEVGTKELSKKNEKEANLFLTSGFHLFSLFFAINMKMLYTKEMEEYKEKEVYTGKKSMMQRFSDIIKNIVDCCKE